MKRFLNSALVATVVTTIAAQAKPADAITFYNDLNSWQSAIGQIDSIEDFNDGGRRIGSSLDFDGFTATSNNSQRDILVEGNVLRLRASSAGVKLVFDSPIRGFFADWGVRGNGNPAGNDRVGELLLLTGNFDGIGQEQIRVRDRLPGPGRTRSGSFGIVGDSLFTELEFISSGRAPENFSIDNFVVGSEPTPIPTPATLPALVGIAAATIRKRYKQNDKS